jgi:hypothetical protein
MVGLKGKLKRLFERVLKNKGLHFADLSEADFSRMQELIRRGLIDEKRTKEGRLYVRRHASNEKLRGGV